MCQPSPPHIAPTAKKSLWTNNLRYTYLLQQRTFLENPIYFNKPTFFQEKRLPSKGIIPDDPISVKKISSIQEMLSKNKILKRNLHQQDNVVPRIVIFNEGKLPEERNVSLLRQRFQQQETQPSQKALSAGQSLSTKKAHTINLLLTSETFLNS